MAIGIAINSPMKIVQPTKNNKKKNNETQGKLVQDTFLS